MPAKHSRSLQTAYDVIASKYFDRYQGHLNQEILDRFLKYFDKPTSLLDLGGGTGRYSKYFLEQGYTVTLVDLSEKQLVFARQLAPKAKIIQADMMEVTFPAEYFGAVWSHYALLHLTKEEAQKIIGNIYSWLKPKGLMMLSVKQGNHEEITNTDKYGVPIERYFSYYQEEEFVKLIQAKGFRVLEHFQQPEAEDPNIVLIAKKPLLRPHPSPLLKGEGIR